MGFAAWLLPGRHRLEPPGTDGWVTAHFHVESPDLARMLVFGLGRQAEVVAPAELKQAVLRAARELLAAD